VGFAKQIDDASKNTSFTFPQDVPRRELQQWVEEAIGWRRPDGTPIRVSPTNETRRLDDVAPLPDDKNEQIRKRPLTRLIVTLVITVVCIGGSLWIGGQGLRYDNSPATLERLSSRDTAYSAGSLSQPMKASNAPSEITGATPSPQSAGHRTAGERASFDATSVDPTAGAPGRLPRSNGSQPSRTQLPDAITAAEEAKLVARAESLIKQFDFVAARLWLAHALEKGSARAAFMMAETYDPRILRSQAYGMRGDAQRAREFYQLAAEAGIEKARERVETLQSDANFDTRVGGEDRSR
jgi:hypothetical protein